MAMTLEEVRDSLREVAAIEATTGMDSGNLYMEMADAITAHITQPAQAVDVGAIREVVEEMGNVRLALGGSVADWHDKLTRALAGEQADLSVYECESCGERPGKPHAPGCVALVRPTSPTDKDQR